MLKESTYRILDITSLLLLILKHSWVVDIVTQVHTEALTEKTLCKELILFFEGSSAVNSRPSLTTELISETTTATNCSAINWISLVDPIMPLRNNQTSHFTIWLLQLSC
ncbi:uncharacterized protein LOC144297911 isoform X2 [Canis aureus]